MSEGNTNQVLASGGAPIATVASSIFEKFLDTLAAVDGYSEVAANLRSVIVDKKSFNEADIRKALFGDVP